jgi:hypothetical protein
MIGRGGGTHCDDFCQDRDDDSEDSNGASVNNG